MSIEKRTAVEDNAAHSGHWPRTLWWTLAGLGLAIVPAVILPGDAPFINDEPLLLLSALDANEAHRLALHGLAGNRGLVYGPLPTWIYQALLLLTHDPVQLVGIHAWMLALCVCGALFWLARGTGLRPPFAVVIALSPYVWFEVRGLWDNSFNIAICAVTLAAYVHFLKHRSRVALAAAVAGLVLAPFVHPMALAFVVPMGLHMLVFERNTLLEHARFVAPFPILFLWLSGNYIRFVLSILSSAGRIQGELISQGPVAFLYPLLGGRFLSADGFSPGVGTSSLAEAARVISLVALPLVWAGMALAAWRILEVLRGRRELGVQEHVAMISLAIVLAQSLLDGMLKLAFFMHYFNATWIAYAMLAWFAADSLLQSTSRLWRAVALVVPLQGVALAIVALDSTMAVHVSPPRYEMTVRQLRDVAQEVVRYPEGTPVVSGLYPLREFPHALTAMKKLAGPQPKPTLAAKRLIVQRRTAEANDRSVQVVAEQ
jgi:hypothetical protein